MMKFSYPASVYKTVFMFLSLVFSGSVCAQTESLPKPKTGAFWENVDYGGGLGVAVSTGYTNITIAPSAIYNFNDYVSLGAGVQYSNLKEKNYYSSNLFGGSLIGLFNPIEVVQLSLEVEETNVNNKYYDLGGDFKRSFWNTGIFLGAGFRQDNFTIGGRVNILYDKNKDIYGSAFMPFVRVYF